MIRNTHGFTVVELCIALMIAGILGAVGAPNLTTFVRHYRSSSSSWVSVHEGDPRRASHVMHTSGVMCSGHSPFFRATVRTRRSSLLTGGLESGLTVSPFGDVAFLRLDPKGQCGNLQE